MATVRETRGVRSLAVLLAVLAGALSSAGTVDSADKKTIVIAVPVGLSGANSVVAPSVVQSAELAAEEINAKGGMLGRNSCSCRRRRQRRRAAH